MTPTLRAGIVAACIATAIPAHAQKGDRSPPPPNTCGRVQATWTPAQKDEHAALMAWIRAREKQKDPLTEAEGKAAQAASEKKLKAAWSREMTEGTRSVQRGNNCGPKR